MHRTASLVADEIIRQATDWSSKYNNEIDFLMQFMRDARDTLAQAGNSNALAALQTPGRNKRARNLAATDLEDQVEESPRKRLMTKRDAVTDEISLQHSFVEACDISPIKGDAAATEEDAYMLDFSSLSKVNLDLKPSSMRRDEALRNATASASLPTSKLPLANSVPEKHEVKASQNVAGEDVVTKEKRPEKQSQARTSVQNKPEKEPFTRDNGNSLGSAVDSSKDEISVQTSFGSSVKPKTSLSDAKQRTARHESLINTLKNLKPKKPIPSIPQKESLNSIAEASIAEESDAETGSSRNATKEGLDESSVEEKSLVQDSFYSVTDGKEDESAISFASVDDTFQSEKKADTFLDESMGADGSASAAEDSIREEEHNNRSEADGGDSSIMDLAMTPRPGHDTVNILAHEETPKSTLLSSAFAATVSAKNAITSVFGAKTPVAAPVPVAGAPRKNTDGGIKSIQSAAALAKKEEAERQRKATQKAKVEQRHEEAMLRKHEADRQLIEKQKLAAQQQRLKTAGASAIPKKIPPHAGASKFNAFAKPAPVRVTPAGTVKWGTGSSHITKNIVLEAPRAQSKGTILDENGKLPDIDSDEDEPIQKNPLPSWASDISKLLRRQKTRDPDTIFGGLGDMPVMVLEEIFADGSDAVKRRLKRGSTGGWTDADRLNEEEDRKYKLAMGLIK